MSDHELLVTSDQNTSVIDAAAYFTPEAVRSDVPDQPVGTSPDGAWIILASQRDGMPELYRARPDGSDAQRLTHSVGQEKFFGWSPDDQWLVFDLDNTNIAITPFPYLMRVDGSSLHPLFDVPGSWLTVAFAPNRRWLIMKDYGLYNPANHGNSNPIFYRASLPDGALTRLTDPNNRYWFQDWSPDGRALIWKWTGQGDNREFDLVDLDTLQTTLLFIGDFAEFHGWTDDSQAAKFTVFDPQRCGAHPIQVNLADQQITEIAMTPPIPTDHLPGSGCS